MNAIEEVHGLPSEIVKYDERNDLIQAQIDTQFAELSLIHNQMDHILLQLEEIHNKANKKELRVYFDPASFIVGIIFLYASFKCHSYIMLWNNDISIM